LPCNPEGGLQVDRDDVLELVCPLLEDAGAREPAAVESLSADIYLHVLNDSYDRMYL
jgi:hypothetical protein